MTLTIHHILNSLDPAGGGVPMVAVQVAAAQAHLGRTVELHAIAHPDDVERQGKSPNQDLAVRLAHLPGMDQVTVRRHRSRANFAQACHTAAAQPSWFHLHGVWDPALITAGKIARQTGQPYCMTPHGMLDPWSLTQSRWKKKIGLYLVHRRLLNKAAFLQALNDDEKRLMRPLNLRTSLEVVPNGVHLPEIEADQAEAALKEFDADLRPGRFYLFLARLHFKKGIDILLDAYAQMKNASGEAKNDSEVWPLVIAGPDEGIGLEIEQRMRDDNFPGPVLVSGPIYGEKKSALLSTAGAVVLPSRQEGFSLTILEALSAARPAVISDQCHFDEVGEAGAGLVVPVDPTATARAMQDVAAMSEEDRRAMGQRGREMVVGQYTWHRVAEMLIELYESRVD